MNKEGGAGKKILVVAIVVVLAVAIYFTFFFYYKCEDATCFRAHQQECKKTKYVNNAENAVWSYRIKGKVGDTCKIEAGIIQIKQGVIEKQKLEDKSMDCYIVFGSTESPEKDLSKCHGRLKEELQNLIIQKLHTYVLENIGEISEELKEISF